MCDFQTKDREVDFDVETAIKVCRQAGYHRHALSLAEKHQKHEWYLKIQLEDIRDYQAALTYIARLHFDAVSWGVGGGGVDVFTLLNRIT